MAQYKYVSFKPRCVCR